MCLSSVLTEFDWLFYISVSGLFDKCQQALTSYRYSTELFCRLCRSGLCHLSPTHHLFGPSPMVVA